MARNNVSPASPVTRMSMTRRVHGVTSMKVPRVQCSKPPGERMHSSKAPPGRMSTLASGTV